MQNCNSNSRLRLRIQFSSLGLTVNAKLFSSAWVLIRILILKVFSLLRLSSSKCSIVFTTSRNKWKTLLTVAPSGRSETTNHFYHHSYSLFSAIFYLKSIGSECRKEEWNATMSSTVYFQNIFLHSDDTACDRCSTLGTSTSTNGHFLKWKINTLFPQFQTNWIFKDFFGLVFLSDKIGETICILEFNCFTKINMQHQKQPGTSWRWLGEQSSSELHVVEGACNKIY